MSDEAQQGFRDALDRLRAIPELLALTWGDDAGHFDDNFDFVAVMDFADFAAARRYVAHPLHQAYIRDHASQVIGERVVVQHDWAGPATDGADHPPADISRRTTPMPPRQRPVR